MSKETELSDEQIDCCVGNLGMAENSILAGPDEIRRAMRAAIAADRELRRGDASLPVIAYLHSTPEGEPIWSEDCVCQDDVYSNNGDDESIGMPLVRLSDAQAALAAKDAEIEMLTKQNSAYASLTKNIDALTAELTAKQIEAGWKATFSTNNPFCPCDLRSFTKAVQWTERHRAAIAKESAKWQKCDSTDAAKSILPSCPASNARQKDNP